MPRFFLSHAGADKALAERLSSLLQTGCNLRGTDIFCTSIEGQGAVTGDLFPEQIRTALREAEFVILLVTPMWWDRPFCIAEAGAAWIREGVKIFPLVLPDLPRDMGANMLGTQTQKLDMNGLDNLRDAIAKYDPEAQAASAKWRTERDLFLEDWEGLKKTIAKPTKVERAQLDEALEDKQQARDDLREARTEIAQLREQLAAVSALKNAAEVKEVNRRYDDEQDQYEALVEAARDSLAGFSSADARGLFEALNEEDWHPSSEAWAFNRAEMEEATGSKMLVEHHEALRANLKHPVMKAAYNAVEELMHFVDGASPELREEIEETHRIPADVRSRDYWRSVLSTNIMG
jgi:hypothetical protein